MRQAGLGAETQHAGQGHRPGRANSQLSTLDPASIGRMPAEPHLSLVQTLTDELATHCPRTLRL